MNLAEDAYTYMLQLWPFFLIISALSFADLTMSFLIKLFKRLRSEFRW